MKERRSTLNERILKEMVIKNPLEIVKNELWKEIGYRYLNYIEFEKEFNKAFKKVKVR